MGAVLLVGGIVIGLNFFKLKKKFAAVANTGTVIITKFISEQKEWVEDKMAELKTKSKEKKAEAKAE